MHGSWRLQGAPGGGDRPLRACATRPPPMLERGGAGAEPSSLRSIPEDKAFLQSPRHSGEGRHAPLRHALQNSLVRSALKNGALICTWCGLTCGLTQLC